MSLLYRFAGQPYVYVAEWSGMPQAASRYRPLSGVKRRRRRRGRRGVGEANFYESSAPLHKRYRPLVKAYSDHVRHSTIEDLSGPPLRESGPEPIDPGEMPSWQVAYLEDPMAQPVGDDSDGSEITMEPMYVGSQPAPTVAAAPLLGLSTNEKRLALVAGAGLLGYFLLRRNRK